MNVDTGRLWVKLISRQALNSYMEFRGETNRSLADKTHGVAKHAIVGHLRSGRRNTCKANTAAAIEAALNAPPGSLFVGETATGQIVTRQPTYGRGRAA